MSVAPPPTPAPSAPSSGAQTPTIAMPDPCTPPDAEQITRPRSESSSSVRRPVKRVDTIADLPPRTRSRRSSFSGHGSFSADQKPSQIVLPARSSISRLASSGELRSGLASPVIPRGAVEFLVTSVNANPSSSPAPLSLVKLRAGQSHKVFQVHKHLLTSKSPYFRQLFAQTLNPAQEDLNYSGLDEYGFALFVRWLYAGSLHGPQDFHGFQHYLGLYVLALKFDVEALCNLVMDTCRAYYRRNGMTAPTYRIEHIYTYTDGPNHMRNFLMTTAAYRCLCEAPSATNKAGMSDSIKQLVTKGGDVAVDMAEALIKLSRNGIEDVRRGPDCKFHLHADGRYCEQEPEEPYMGK